MFLEIEGLFIHHISADNESVKVVFFERAEDVCDWTSLKAKEVMRQVVVEVIENDYLSALEMAVELVHEHMDELRENND